MEKLIKDNQVSMSLTHFDLLHLCCALAQNYSALKIDMTEQGQIKLDDLLERLCHKFNEVTKIQYN
jgi:5-keto 4-deoxyuronate isomerase